MTIFSKCPLCGSFWSRFDIKHIFQSHYDGSKKYDGMEICSECYGILTFGELIIIKNKQSSSCTKQETEK